MKIEVLADDDAVARRGAELIVAAAQRAIAERNRFVMAVSGGKTPWQMFRLLADFDLPWERIHVCQVDERVAPDGDPVRNLTHLRQSLVDRLKIPCLLHPMPVTRSPLEAAADEYAETLRSIAGSIPVLDLVHLGLGADGHTASLVPGDDVLQVTDRDVASTGVYQQHRRMTLTFPILNRARQILWLITGPDKTPMLARLEQADPAIPAGRIRQTEAILLTDRATAPQPPQTY